MSTVNAETRGYWSSVFYEATVLLEQRPQIGGETAFWMARGIVDQQLDLQLETKTLETANATR